MMGRGSSRRRVASAGFTLIELLVALFITAILFAMGYGALDQALRGREEVTTQTERLANVQRALRVMEQDFELLQPRPVRDPLGGNYLPALVSGISPASNATAPRGTTGATIVSFTRGGWSNPAGVQRSELQRAGYIVRDGNLVRLYWDVLDPIAGAQPRERMLLKDVEGLVFRYMDDGHQWQASWPPPNAGALLNLQILRQRPVAVEVTLTLKDWGPIVRVIEVAG